MVVKKSSSKKETKSDKDELDEMLKESDVLLMLEKEQKQHEKRLKGLHDRLGLFVFVSFFL